MKVTLQSDVVGATASGLCVIHCMMTPLLFLAQSGSIDGCAHLGPEWWSSIDFLFIGVTAIAVYQSGTKTSKVMVKYAMIGTWVILSLLIINEKLNALYLPETLKYAVAFGLIILHLYNLKYCQCSGDTCCAP